VIYSFTELYDLFADPTPVNQAPTPDADSATTSEDQAIAIAALANDTDPDGDALTITGATNGANGSVTVNANGTLTYAPTANFNGQDSFSYTVSDGKGGTASAQVTVVVTPVNDAPVAVNNSATTAEDQAIAITVLGNDVDPDGDTLTVTGATNGANGAVTLNANGTLTYAPKANFHGQDSFTYTISDGKGGTASAQVIVTVNPINDGPVAVNDSAATLAGTPVTVQVLANDTDLDGDALTVAAVGAGANGTAQINPDGTITYTPQAGFTGQDSFSYTVADGRGGTATAVVGITVDAVPGSIPAPWSPSTVIFSNATSSSNQQVLTDSYTLVADQPGTVTLSGGTLAIDGVGASAGISVTTAADGAVDVRLDSAWNSVGNVAVIDEDSADVTIHNFVHADAALGGDGDSTVTITNAKRGSIATGGGNDTIDVTAYSDAAGSGNLFDIATGAGDDRITLRGYVTYTAAVIAGGDGNDTIAVIGSGADLLYGGAGDDVLSGDAGNDVLDGGAGADRLIGGKGSDIYVVADAGDVVDESVSGSAGGVDLVQSSVSFDLSPHAYVENLTLTGAGNIDGTGNALKNAITGNDGDNRLDGGAGADTLTGGKGDDVYVVNVSGDKVVETLTVDQGGGIDMVESSMTWSLANLANVENLTLTGTANIKGTGNALDNFLVGNAGGNTLDGGSGNDMLLGGDGVDTLIGGAGNDTLIGGRGSDKLTGGLGRDIFEFADMSEAGDKITDFVKGAAGDVLKLTDILDGFGPGDDLFAGGFLDFQKSGSSTVVRVDVDGGGDSFQTLVTINNVVLTAADTSNYVYVD
jgi:VCBS repeat-containing protein